MLGKLLKYEFKATARTFLPIYAAILIISVVIRFSNIYSSEFSTLAIISVMVLFGLFVALIVATFMMIIGRFNSNLLSDEGYLMFTLPVSTHSLILSKVITAIIWTICSTLVAIPVGLILTINSDMILELSNLWPELMKLFGELSAEHYVTVIITILVVLFEYISFILAVYTALAIGQIGQFNKHRTLASFVAFFAINIITGAVAANLMNIVTSNFEISNTINDFRTAMSFALVYNVSWSLILYFATNYLLKNHLNIE